MKKEGLEYDENNELDLFKNQFRTVWAESILKRFIQKSQKGEGYQIAKLLISLNITEKRLLTADEVIEQFGLISSNDLCSGPEWEVLRLSNKEFEKKNMDQMLSD